MHPLGMYLAIATGEREQEWADDDERAGWMARADAESRATREPGRRIRRLTESLRRRFPGLSASTRTAALPGVPSPSSMAISPGGLELGHLNLVEDRRSAE